MSNHPSSSNADSVIARIRRRKNKGVTRSELARSTGIDPAVLSKQLQQLEEEGVCIELEHRWYLISGGPWSVGIVRKLERGDALLLLEVRGDATFFIPRRHLKGARDGDLVAVRGMTGRSRGGSLPAAKIVKVLARAHQRLVGIVTESARWNRVLPLDPRLRLVVWVEGDGLTTDTVVEVELSDRNHRDGVVGVVNRSLGSIEDPSNDTSTVIAQYEIPETFSDGALMAAQALPVDPRPSDWQGRKDLRELPTVTIDGDDAKDFDDAISLKRLESGYRLWVHIADVAHYVALDSSLDLDARQRGTSVYFADRVVPMLPEELSNGLCSLRPNVPRLTMTAELDFGGDGEVTRRKLFQSVIQSDRRSTYNEVESFLQQKPIDGITGTPLAEMLLVADELLSKRLDVRSERGALDLEIPESRIEVDKRGVPLAVHRLQRNRAHRLVEEFMLAANEAVATDLVMAEVGSVHRVHPAPDLAASEELGGALRALGLEAPLGLEALHPTGLSELLSSAADRGLDAVVGRLILRSLQRAYYAHESQGHFALALRHYTHFTSPIRRYPDLLVHRSLKAYWSGTPSPVSASQYQELSAHGSETERRAERAERELTLIKKLRLLSGSEGDLHNGTIVGVGKVGLFVELEDLLVDGVVQRSFLSDDRYQLQPERFRWVGLHHGRTWTLGDRIEVEIREVNVAFRRLELGVPEMPEPFGYSRSGSSRRHSSGARGRRR